MSAQQERPAYPAPVLAAAILAAEGVSFLLVGSAALWLHGEAISVADADVVIEPAEENLHRLGDALAELALQRQEVPRVRALPWRTGVLICLSRTSVTSHPNAMVTCWSVFPPAGPRQSSCVSSS